MTLKETYAHHYNNVLLGLAKNVEGQLRDYLNLELRVDRVSARAKSVDRFLAKADAINNGEKKYQEPLSQIQDQIGARIITFYLDDVERISKIILKYYRPIEMRAVLPESQWEFGYFGKHFILFIPDELYDCGTDLDTAPKFFELQIKTLFQHAWSEANHDLGYKPGATPLTPDQNRRLAFTAAQAWGADTIFDELFRHRASTDT